MPHDFMPHGYCYLWDPLLLWLHVSSDALITVSYYCIPVVLIYFIRKNRNIPFNRIFWMFGTFILACGTTHLMEIWNVWHGSYLLAGVIKAITAVASVITAAMLIPLVPRVMSLSGQIQLQEVNRNLERQIAERKRFDAPVNAPLRRRVTGGFIIAVLLTIFLGFASWRGAQRAEQDAYWVSHTHEVMETVQRTTRNVIEAESSARGFALSGQEPLLVHYQAARNDVHWDEDALRHLTADNQSQQLRINKLEWQVGSALQFADSIIAKRRQLGAYPGGSRDAVETERLLDIVRATTRDMYAEEARLLTQRSETAQAGRQRTRVIAVLGVFLSVVLWLLARLAVNREINISERARTQLSILNAELEQRVEQRTAALQFEVAEREQAGEALKHSLKDLADQKFALDQHAIVATTDVQGTITYVNDKFCAISKYSKEELIGQNHRILNSRHHSKEFFQQMYHTIANGQVWRGEICNRAKDGSIYWVDTTVVPLLDSGGKPRQYMAIRADITERKQAEQALQQSLVTSEAALKELADQKFALDQHAIVATTDVQGTITYVNDKFCTISGYSKDELLGRNHRILNSAHHPKEFFQQMYHAIANGQVWHDEICNRAKDGSLYWVDTTIVPLAAEDGKPRQYIAIRADVTQRKQAEVALVQKAEELALKSAELAGSREALESQTLMLQSVLDSMSEGLVATDTQGKFILWNPAAERIVGMGPAEMSPEQWTTHDGVYLPDAVTPFPPEQNPSLRAIHGEASAAEMFLKNRTLGGGIWIEINGSPLKDKNGVLRGGVAAFRDISRRRADEREIRKLNEELELRVATRTAELQSANKELEAFSYSISHDLRAPLRHISGFARIVIEDFAPSLPAEAQRHLQRIEQGAGRMGQLVDELLNLTRVGRQTLAVHATGLGSVVQDVITMLEPEIAGRQVQWKVAELPIVECDAILVRQVFQNLIGNALKYSRPRSPAVIEIGQTVKDGQTVIFVRDNGVGFSMKYADKLFGVFQRLHRAEDFEGTGVGLATVHRIVQKHGGQVWAEAEIDHGATFYFTLGTLARSESKALAANSGG